MHILCNILRIFTIIVAIIGIITIIITNNLSVIIVKIFVSNANILIISTRQVIIIAVIKKKNHLKLLISRAEETYGREEVLVLQNFQKY